MEVPPRAVVRKCVSRIRHHMSPAHLVPVFGLARELELVGRFCEQTEVNKESHATLLMGPHNTGKSLVLNTVLRDLEARTGNKPVVIVLDGYLHADEAAALVVIGDVLGMQAELAQQQQRQTQADQQQQLQQEQEQEDKQEEQEHERQQESAARASAAEEISAITELTFHSTVLAMLNCWKQVNPGRAVFFVLDQMELFTKSKQNLLYSLLNLMQEKEPPVAIIGMAGVLHIMDMLEKRVKSRFSDRYILFLPNASMEQALHILRHVLLLPDGFSTHPHAKEWNSRVVALLEDKEFLEFLAQRQDVKSDPKDLFNLLHVAMKDIDERHPFLTVHDFRKAAAFMSPDMKLQALKGAPALEMGLLVAMKLFEEDKIEEYNFEMVYDRFQKFARDEFMSVTKPTAFAAFESLLEQELIKKVARRAEEKATPKGFLMVRLMPIPAQIEDVLRDPACMLPQSVVTWGTKWVS